jgi:tetratricopeptide (TPR) repeat protein
MQDLDAHKTDAAAAYIVRSFGHDNLRAQRSLLQGRLFLDAQKLSAARQTFGEAVGNSTYASMAQFWLGATTYAMGDTQQAEQYWLQALEGLPNDPSVHRSLAVLYYDRGAIDRAVHHLQNVAKLDPKDARPLRLLGLIHKDYERYAEAADYYRQALARGLVAQTREQVHVELVECLLKTREYEAGLKVLENASMTYDAVALKAECLIGLGRSSEATAELDELLAKDNQHFPSLLARASIYREQREFPQAIALLQRAVSIKSADYLAHFRLSQALRSAGSTAEADAEAARAEEIKLLRERFSKLHQDANERPSDADVRFELGQLAEQLKLPELAAIWYKACLELNPNHPAARQNLAGIR